MPNVKILNLSGGMKTRPQLDSLSHGAHIIVGTPGRIQKHLDLRSIRFNKLQTLVLDEADRMLDMGFYDDIEAVIAKCPRGRQTLLFSATFTKEIKTLAAQFMRTPQEIVADALPDEVDIEQRFYKVESQAQKYPLLKSLLLHYQPESSLIFCTTKLQTVELVEMLKKDGFSAAALNGDMEQFERDIAVIHFANKSCRILVATDVAARGLDIKELPAVINFDLPSDDDVYTHRIGRTGRASSKGLALSIVLKAQLKDSMRVSDSNELEARSAKSLVPQMTTLCLASGKRDKIRAGDILGALVKDAGLPGDAVGKINITDNYSYVAVRREHVQKAIKYFENGKLKGRKVRLHKGN
jgi:ATP-independent RNA helicase DbpA